MGFGCSFMGDGGVILASSARERIGVVHEMAARIMRGDVAEVQITAEAAAASGGKMKEGFNIPILVEGQRVASCGIAGPLEVVRPLAYVLTSLIGAVITYRVTDQFRTSQVADQVAKAAGIAAVASDAAQKTDSAMEKLTLATSRIGEVVTVINKIAKQTNLLALNATIEAARAGDAGKGFAVVAGEVKSLANQTARATEEVARQIAEMRANTQQAVGAIDEVAQTIGRIDEMTAAIAAAVEQQGAATRDISANVQQAAAGTGEVTQAIAGVATSSSVTGEAARALAQAVQGMDAERRKLGQAIATFMDGVRGAAAAPSRSPVRNGPACDKPAS
jgi:uncharacterized protein (UPF0333 family)